MREVLVFQCDYCKKKGVKATIERHEKKCFYNPINEACGSCLMFDICDQKDKFKGMTGNACREWLDRRDFQ